MKGNKDNRVGVVKVRSRLDAESQGGAVVE